MADVATDKHFLDTSVARSMLLGSQPYKRYFKDQFGENRLYISRYVKMEFKRSYLSPIIDFYFVLDMPSIESIGDAFGIWSNRFKKSELKAVLQLVGQLINSRELDLSNPNDKRKALRAIGFYVKRLEIKLKIRFKNISTNDTRCARAMPSLISARQNIELTESLGRFRERVNDVEACRNQCTVDHFLLDRHKSQVKRYIKEASELASPKSKRNRGFIRIAENLEKIHQRGSEACSCYMCEAIGDAVIALEAPRDMRLEHTDQAFDHLCRIVGQPPYKHPSELSISKTLEVKK